MMEIQELEALLSSMPSNKWGEALGLSVSWKKHAALVAFLPDGAIALEVALPCSVCGGQPYTVYVCRDGDGWCHAFSRSGEYEADLSRRVYICQECVLRKRSVPIDMVTFPQIIEPPPGPYFPPQPPAIGREKWS